MTLCANYDAVILACGGGSYRALGGDGAWQQWFDKDLLTPLYASNVGVLVDWSSFMVPLFGQPLKRIQISVGEKVVSRGCHHQPLWTRKRTDLSSQSGNALLSKKKRLSFIGRSDA